MKWIKLSEQKPEFKVTPYAVKIKTPDLPEKGFFQSSKGEQRITWAFWNFKLLTVKELTQDTISYKIDWGFTETFNDHRFFLEHVIEWMELPE